MKPNKHPPHIAALLAQLRRIPRKERLKRYFIRRELYNYGIELPGGKFEPNCDCNRPVECIYSNEFMCNFCRAAADRRKMEDAPTLDERSKYLREIAKYQTVYKVTL